MKWGVPVLLFVASFFAATRLVGQAPDGTMSEGEVETLRDAAYIPSDRILAYERILDTRMKRLEDLLAKRRHVGREQDVHDILDQFATITDEFADNLDDYRKRHRDVRKMLPKLIQATERWSTALQAPPEDDTYKIVRKLALDNLKDLRDEAISMGPELDGYFKEHPDALKQEKERMDPDRAHAPQ